MCAKQNNNILQENLVFHRVTMTISCLGALSHQGLGLYKGSPDQTHDTADLPFDEKDIGLHTTKPVQLPITLLFSY